MAYVYQKVARDPSSRQTPHFGYLDGDGDLILSGFHPSEEENEQLKDEDSLVSVPAVMVNETGGETMDILDQAKELLSEERHRIKLHELVAGKVREVLSTSSEDHFPIQAPWSSDEFLERLKKYEALMTDLCKLQALMAAWGTEAHRDTITLAAKRICDRLKRQSGNSGWIALRWYPALLLLYSGGVASVARSQFGNLRVQMQASVADPDRGSGQITLIRGVTSRFYDDLHNVFKYLPDHKNNYAPLSEYLFKYLQPMLDDLLFLGGDYESCFDRFEVLFALEHAEEYAREDFGRVWGPVGRFGWKMRRHSNPLQNIIAEAEAQGESWPPIQAGLFAGSLDRFKTIASGYSQFVAGLNWF